MIVAIAAVVGLVIGFLTGLAVYAQVYSNFLVRAEARAQKRLSAELMRQKMVDQKALTLRRKLREQYGDDLSVKHQEVVDEEIERILGAGPQ